MPTLLLTCPGCEGWTVEAPQHTPSAALNALMEHATDCFGLPA